MKTQRKVFKFFSVVDWEEEEAFLRSMHRNGWKLVSGGLVYTFDRCQPEDVIYQLDYNDASHKDRDTYLQLFNDLGWEYIQDFGGYSYFRKPAAEMNSNEDGIFCDDVSRLEMVGRVWKGRMIPILIVFSLLIEPQLVMRLVANNVLLTFIYWGLFAVYLYIFIKFGIKFARLRASVK